MKRDGILVSTVQLKRYIVIGYSHKEHEINKLSFDKNRLN